MSGSQSGLSITAEELRRRERARSTTPPEQRSRCPACRSVNVRKKVGGPCRLPRADGQYMCRHCGEHFDEPVTGESEVAVGG